MQPGARVIEIDDSGVGFGLKLPPTFLQNAAKGPPKGFQVAGGPTLVFQTLKALGRLLEALGAENRIRIDFAWILSRFGVDSGCSLIDFAWIWARFGWNFVSPP